ncbi:MAG: DUF2116 family Zn-ribbon domain-containing protein [Nanopusillaceae archaeon]
MGQEMGQGMGQGLEEKVLLEFMRHFVSIYHKLRHKNIKKVVICQNCGKEVVRNSKKAKFCSDKCRNEYHNKQRRLKKN